MEYCGATHYFLISLELILQRHQKHAILYNDWSIYYDEIYG